MRPAALLGAALASLIAVLPACAGGAGNDGLIDPAILAPSYSDTKKSLELLASLVADAETTAHALFRVHNRFAELRVAVEKKPTCEMSAERTAPAGSFADLAARARLLGAATRDSVQSARAQARRVDAELDAPTVKPLVDPKLRPQAQRLRDRIAKLETSYLEAAAWQSRQIERYLASCRAEPAPAAGLSGGTLVDSEQDSAPKAVIVTADGWICPDHSRLRAGVAIVGGGKLCYSAAHCDCEPETVLPAAVLGPPRSR